MVDKQGAAALGVATTDQLINSVDAPVLANTAEVETGCTVNGIYLRVECYATTAGALSNVYLIIYKNPGGNLAGITPNGVGVSDNKRFVIHQEMIMLQKVVAGNPRTLFNGVIGIPRGYRRFAINDLLTLRILAPGVNIDFCFQCHYKEFR